jgi:hypothetical protein
MLRASVLARSMLRARTLAATPPQHLKPCRITPPADVEADDQPQLHSFAAGIRRDLHAVTAGLTLPHSSGAAEGNVN